MGAPSVPQTGSSCSSRRAGWPVDQGRVELALRAADAVHVACRAGAGPGRPNERGGAPVPGRGRIAAVLQERGRPDDRAPRERRRLRDPARRILVNQVLGSPVEGGLGNVYLRRRTARGITFVPLLGTGLPSRFRAIRAAAPPGRARSMGSTTRCTLRLQPTAADLVLDVRARQYAPGRRLSLDAVLAQDLGIAARGRRPQQRGVHEPVHRSHRAARPGLGFLVCSRQNMPQGGAHPVDHARLFEGAVGFLTDGFQFYWSRLQGSGQTGRAARSSTPPVLDATGGRRRRPDRETADVLPSLCGSPGSGGRGRRRRGRARARPRVRGAPA